MIEDNKGKIIVKEKIVINIKNYSLKTRNIKKIENSSTFKKITPTDKMILIRKKKDISDKYAKLNILSETKNYSIISQKNNEIHTDNIDSLKLLNDCLGVNYKKSTSIPIKHFMTDKKESNKEETINKISKDSVKRNLRCFLSNDEIVTQTYKNNGSKNEYSGICEKFSPPKEAQLSMKIKHLNTVTNFSDEKCYSNLLAKKISIKNRLNTENSFNNKFIYTRDILPKINKFNALQIKNNCRRRLDKLFDRRSSIKKFEESDKILKENLSIFN
jgi:hypothetical protein